jgi:hypothetical protein
LAQIRQRFLTLAAYLRQCGKEDVIDIADLFQANSFLYSASAP